MRFHFLLPILRRPHYLLLLYVGLSFFLMSHNSPAQLRGVRLAILSLVESWKGLEKSLWQREASRKQLEALQEENFQLQMANLRLREMLLENIRLRRLLQLQSNSSFAYLTARVIGLGTERGIQSIILDRGSEDGVRKDMPVVTPDGLVGKVVAVTPGQSIVQVLMDHNSLVSARLQGSREVGIISWEGEPWLRLLYVPKTVPVEEGELVLTSGLSKIYPAGLKIGVVRQVQENRRGFFKEIRVQPAVNFQRLEEVFILLGERQGQKGKSTP